MAPAQRHATSKIIFCSCINILCTLLLPYVATLASQPSFNDPSVSFNNIAVDSRTGYVYIGAVNKIYKLSSDLQVEQAVNTALDGKLKDSVNKVLLIDYRSNNLITCGSANGYCSVRNLSNISEAREIKEPVVYNNAEASTVAFIAQGTGLKQVMYVGTTYAPNSDDFVNPAVSSRSLEDDRLFNIDQTGTKMYVNSLSRERYPIKYVYGFSSEGFSYFLTTQMKEGGSGYHSKLVRVCHDDENYYSYTEIPITCNGEDNNYNLAQAAFVGKGGSILNNELGLNTQQEVLFAAFSTSDTENSSKPSKSSAICIYPLKDIKRKFTQNIQSCFKGIGSRGLDFLTPSSPCVSTKLEINEDFCGIDVNTPLGGDAPVESVPVSTFNERITDIIVARTSRYTVLFAATAQGHLKKILVEGSTAIAYDDIVSEKGSSIKDIVFDTQQSHLYVLLEHKVFKINVHECSAYQSCSTCLGAKDPYCGWCPTKNKCSTQSDCENDSLIHWRQNIPPYRNDTCAKIIHVNPQQLQRTTSEYLSIFINNMPATHEQFYCVFRVLNLSITTLATREVYGVDCDSPPVSTLPSFPANHHQITAELIVRTNSYANVASTNILFTDCSSYTSCTECTTSSYPCEWCVDSDRCTHDGATYCRNDILVTGNSSSNGPGSNSCVSFHSKSDNEISVHSGVKKSIAVKAKVPEYAIQSRFLCEYIIQGEKFRVNAQLLGDTIYCERFEFAYASPDPYITASFNILWGGSKKLDNPDNVHIVIYRCNLAENCGSCLTIQEKFQCGWCEGSNKCELQDNCKTPSVWFSQNRVCPNPEIHSIKPQFGPWEGGTKITIVGVNLGRSISDIGHVDVAGTYCEPIPELYVKTKQIVCTAVGPGNDKPREGPVVVNVAEYRGISNVNYSFINPIINSIEPTYGPQSGGTVLKIDGEYLNAGSDIKIYIDDSMCYIISTSHNRIMCKTSHSHAPKFGTVRIIFDNASRVLDSPKFEYVEDPVILSVETGISSQKQPRGIPSGGTSIKVLGHNFRAVKSPKIHVYYKNRSFTAPCNKVEDDSQLSCESPKIEDVTDQQQPLELEYGFDMDGVESVRRVSDELGSFILYPDPTYERFDGVKELKSDYLTINGDNIDKVSTSEEIEVRIGDKQCIVTSISRHQLTCRPPALNELSGGVDAYDVEVKVGRNLKFNIGKISYSQI